MTLGDAAATRPNGRINTTTPSLSTPTTMSTTTATITTANPNPDEAASSSPDPTADPVATVMAAAARLDALTARAESTHTHLDTRLSSTLAEITSTHARLTSQSALSADTLQRAAKALSVRALTLDNALLSLADQQATLADDRAQLDMRASRIDAGLAQRTALLDARDASVRFSSLEQGRLHAWARSLDARDDALSSLESSEADRIAETRAQLAARQRDAVVALRKREESLTRREAEAAVRERAVAKLEEESRQQRADMLLQMEADRAAFWAHIQDISAQIGEQIAQLQASQEVLRTQFDEGASYTRKALQDMDASVTSLDADINGAVATINKRNFNNAQRDNGVAKGTAIVHGHVDPEAVQCLLANLSVHDSVLEVTTPTKPGRQRK